VEKICQEIGYDFNGVVKPQSEKDNYKLAYAEFVVPLTKAIQEQQEMISKFELEVKALKGEIIELKKAK
jgi:trimeric autotransporter adhesin